MVRSLIPYGQKAAKAGAKTGNTFTMSNISRPVTVLAFLIAVVLSVLVIRNTQTSSSQSSELQQDTIDQVAPAETKQSDAVQSSETPASAPGEQSINTEMRVENGQTDVNVEVNGQQVPINDEGTTHQTITQDGSQTTVDVNIQNGQTNAVVNTDGNNNSSSFTSSFQSQTVIFSP